MTKDLDIEIEFEEEVKFILDGYTVYYNSTHNEWYAECEESEFYEYVNISKFDDTETITLFEKYKLTLTQFTELQLLI